MKPALKLAAFAVGLAAAFGAGAAMGAVAGPIEVTDTSEHPAVRDEAPPSTTVGHPADHEAQG